MSINAAQCINVNLHTSRRAGHRTRYTTSREFDCNFLIRQVFEIAQQLIEYWLIISITIDSR